MQEDIKPIDFSSEITIKELYNLFKTNSSPMNTEILSKLQNYPTSTTFFKHYMNKDIKKFYVHMNNFINELSSLTNENKKNLFNANVDKYISDFSNIYVIFHLITKINDSLESILLNTKDHLSKLYEKYKLDENNQEKINQCLQQMLHFSQYDGLKRNFASKSFDKENSNYEFNKLNEKEYYKTNRAQFLIDDLLGKDKNPFNDIDGTPRFNSDDNIILSLSNNTNNNTFSMNDNDSINNNNKKLNLLKKQQSLDSQFSQFTLASTKKKIFVNQEKENITNNKMYNISKVKIDKEPDDINYNNYNILNVNHEEKFKRHTKKRNSCYIKTNQNIFKNKSKEETHKAQLLSSYKGNSNNPKNTNQLDIYKQFHISSSHLFMKEDAKKYAELLEIIIELYKNKKISLQQKIKLKKLTVCKSPKILNIYNYFNNDNEKFIKELKQLIQ